jgi:hypothetical protein
MVVGLLGGSGMAVGLTWMRRNGVDTNWLLVPASAIAGTILGGAFFVFMSLIGGLALSTGDPSLGGFLIVTMLAAAGAYTWFSMFDRPSDEVSRYAAGMGLSVAGTLVLDAIALILFV